MRLVVMGLCLAACGRVRFDPHVSGDGGSGSGSGSSCIDDNFSAGVTGWTMLEDDWTVDPSAGPNGGPALDTGPTNGASLIEVPGIVGIQSFDLQLDFLIGSAAVGDFLIRIVSHNRLAPGDRDPGDLVGIFPAGSDSGDDKIIMNDSSNVSTPALIAGATWNHVEVVRLPDESIRVLLNGMPHMEIGPDSSLPDSRDVLIEFYFGGMIANVHATCQ